MNTRILSVVVTLVSLIACSTSQAVGLGVSVQEDTGIIYLPLQVNDVTVEPFVRYRQSEMSLNGSTRDESALYAGVGLFLRQPLAERTALYYGARLFWTQMESDSGKDVIEGEGYGISPALGLEYAVAEKVAIALETSLDYSNLTQTAKDTTSSMKLERVDYQTNANLILRFYF